MGKLIYIANTSLDGYTADRAGDFSFTVPSAEVFAAITALVRPAGTYLYGRRMYETMRVWDTAHLDDRGPAFSPAGVALEREFATLWRAAEKIVYSTTLADVSTPRTRLERAVDADAIRRLVAASAHDVLVGGPHLAAEMFAADLVDELHAFIAPIVLGGGNAWLPRDRGRIALALAGERRFGDIVHVHYRRAR